MPDPDQTSVGAAGRDARPIVEQQSAFDGSPRARWWVVAVAAGLAWVLLRPHESDPASISVMIAAIPVTALWAATVADKVRPLAERAWQGPREAALTLFMQRRRFGWSWFAAVSVLVAWPREGEVWGPGSAALTVAVTALTVVFISLPERRHGRWASPLGVVFGRGPSYLPEGTRLMVLFGFVPFALAEAYSVGVFGSWPADDQALTGALIVWSTVSVMGIQSSRRRR